MKELKFRTTEWPAPEEKGRDGVRAASMNERWAPPEEETREMTCLMGVVDMAVS